MDVDGCIDAQGEETYLAKTRFDSTCEQGNCCERMGGQGRRGCERKQALEIGETMCLERTEIRNQH